MPTDTSLYKNIKVLYAEDEEGIRENISFILSLLFKEVLVAKDGQEALELFEEGKPDLLIFDICMPKIDGLDVLKEIRKTDKDIPAIMLTAHTEQHYLFRAVELKISRYLLKPFSKDELLGAMNEAIASLFKGETKVTLAKGYTFDFATNRLDFEGNQITLTLQELKLIQTLSKEPEKIFTFDELTESIWGWEVVTKEALKSLIKTLRKKLPEPLLENIFGVGYTIVKPT